MAFTLAPHPDTGHHLLHDGKVIGRVWPATAVCRSWYVEIDRDVCPVPPAPLRRWFNTFASLAQLKSKLGIASDERRAA